MGTAIKPDGVKPSFVIFDIRALWRLPLSVTHPWASECPDVKNYKWRLDALYLYPYGNNGNQRVNLAAVAAALHLCFIDVLHSLLFVGW